MVATWPGRRPRFVLAVMALAFLGSLFPRGYMPVNDSGRITVALCSAPGRQRMIEIDLGRKPQPRQHSGSSHCDGVFAGLAILPTAVHEVEPALFRPGPVPTIAQFRLRERFHFDPNAPPRAPPISVA